MKNATANVKAESVLALDFGSVNTRALLFDVVEEQYHLIAIGVSPSTVDAPYYDVGECTHLALRRLEEITGRMLLDSETQSLILPTLEDGEGVDRLVVTISAGKPLRMVTTGLLADVSSESIQRLASGTYGQQVETIGLNDRRPTEELLDAVLQAKPDLVLISGGTDNGATRSVLKMVELIVMACHLTPDTKRPAIIYAGNQVLKDRVKKSLEKLTAVYTAPNVRPSIDIEDLNPAQQQLSEIVGLIRAYQIGGLDDLSRISGTPIIPTAHSFGRMIRFLSRVNPPGRGVLGIDLGARSAVVAAASGGRLLMNVLPFGMGSGIPDFLRNGGLELVKQWVTRDISEDAISDYLWQKSLFPASVPISKEAIVVEAALVRAILQLASRHTLERWGITGTPYEPVLVNGAVFSQNASPLQTMWSLLDGLQPVGVSTIILDQGGLTSSLGAISSINTILPVQVIDSGAYPNLGTVICPISREKNGRPILKIRVEYEDGKKAAFEVKQGSMKVLPIQTGQVARVHLEALRRTQLDINKKSTSRSIKIIGGLCGAVVDARGRPLKLPTDIDKRLALMQIWAKSLGVAI